MPELYPFQINLVNRIVSAPGDVYVTAEMGLGKCAIAASSIPFGDSVLIVCPAVVRSHWKAEFEKWTGMEAEIVTDVKDPLPQVGVISYELAVKLAAKPKHCRNFIIFDEAHYLKNPKAMRTLILLLRPNALATWGEKRIFLSGTPTPNHVGELWPILKFMGVVNGTFAAFARRYCTFETTWIFQKGRRISVERINGTNEKTIPVLQKVVSPHLFRARYESAGITLPRIVTENLLVDGSTDSTAWDLERNLQSLWDATFKTEDPAKAIDPLAGLMALQSSLGGLRKMHALRKVKPLAGLIANELDSGQYKKLVVFAHHTQVLEDLVSELKNKNVRALAAHGKMSHEARAIQVAHFQADSNATQVLAASIQAMGIGINLHTSNQCLFVEQSYVPAENAQALGRLRRIGQKMDTVFCRIATLGDSGIDQRVQEILTQKTLDLKKFWE